MANLVILLTIVASLALVQPRVIDKHLDAYAQSEREFSIHLLKSLQKTFPNQTHIFSPHSIYKVLTLAHLIAGGHTEEKLASALNFNWAHSKQDVLNAYLAEDEQRNSRDFDTTEFDSADRLFVSDALGIE